jgi:uncharacterized membrane protein YvbJ
VRFCPKCGTSNYVYGVNCAHCLEPLTPEKKKAEPLPWHCPGCNKGNTSRHERCWNCGKPRPSNDSTLRPKLSAEEEDDGEEAWTPWGL